MNVAPVQAHVAATFVEQRESTFSLRKFSIIDVPYTALLRGINYCAASCLRRPLFSDERLLTHKDKQIKTLLHVLKDKPACASFADTAASFLKTAIGHIAGSQMTHLPSVAATWMRSLARIRCGIFGYGALYAKDRLDRSIHIDDSIRATSTVTALDRLFCRSRTYFAQYVIGSGVNYSVNLKHLVLSGLVGVDKLEQKLAVEAKAGMPKRVTTLIESLGTILAKQADTDKKIAEKNLDPKSEDAFIVRLETLKEDLPPGLPNPVDIKAGELLKKRDEALLQYGKQLATWFFEKHAPDGLHRGLFGWLWELEGEYQTIEIAASLITEFGLRQIVDPHRLYVACLTAFGAETMEVEHDKYGANTRERIFKTGRDMMEQALNPNASSYSIVKIFNESGLNSAPGGSQVTDQKQKAREQLKRIISGMIYDKLKADDKGIAPRSVQATFNTVAEQVSRLPGIGAAPIFIRGLVNGAVFTINHIREGSNTPWILGLVKHLSGKMQTDYLADKILELIDHPSWPIIALKIVDTMVKSFSAAEQDRIIAESDTAQHFQEIGSFLIKNALTPFFGKESKVVSEATSGLASGKVLAEFKNMFNAPQNVAFLATALPLIQPTIKELELYMRVTDIFRKLGVTHKDDTKFWECFIRERLYRQVDPNLDETGKLRKTPGYGPSRETILNALMALDDLSLCKELSKPIPIVPLPVIKKLESSKDPLQMDYDPKKEDPVIQLKTPVPKPTPQKTGWLSGWW